MKIKWSLIYAMMAIILLLSACGTSETGNDNTTSDGKDDTTVEDIVVNPEDSDEDTLEQDGKANAEEDTDIAIDKPDEDTTPMEEEVTKEGQQVNSDEQDYTINLLTNYELTSEEPGRDILYSSEDQTRFMRIETMDNEEGNYDYLKDNMLVVLEASANGETPVELTDDASLPSGDSVAKAVSYKVNTETGPVTGIIFERGDLIVRLTIFDSANEDYFGDFLKMGETVSHK